MADVNKISTDSDMLNEIGMQAAGQQAGIPTVQPFIPSVSSSELQTTAGVTLDQLPTTPTYVSVPAPEVVAPAVSTPNLGVVQGIERITPGVTAAETAQIGAAPQIDFSQIEGQVSAPSVAQAATQELDCLASKKANLFRHGHLRLLVRLQELCKHGVLVLVRWLQQL
jgi:hypothetical protein